MRLIALLVARDLGQAWRSAGLWLPVAFLLLVASLYPFAVGPDAALLAKFGALRISHGFKPLFAIN